MSTTETGREAEELVANYLRKNKHKIIAMNWRTRWCEIDIVSKTKNCVYFTEVKFRSSENWGSGLSYITKTKLKQMKFAAEMWISDNNWEWRSSSSSGRSRYRPKYIDCRNSIIVVLYKKVYNNIMKRQSGEEARYTMLGYDVFDSSESLGMQLYNFANENREYLLARGLNGFVDRYGGNPELSIEDGMEQAIQSADKGRFNHAKRISGHYLRFDDDGIVDCVGSIQVGLPLTRPIVPIMPAVVSRKVPLLSRNVAVDVNVSAVTRYDNDRLNGAQLAKCYEFLLGKTVSWVDDSKKEGFTAWTLLPRANFSFNGEVYKAIVSAGMEQTEIARFDEGETRGVPVLSFLLSRSFTSESN